MKYDLVPITNSQDNKTDQTKIKQVSFSYIVDKPLYQHLKRALYKLVILDDRSHRRLNTKTTGR